MKNYLLMVLFLTGLLLYSEPIFATDAPMGQSNTADTQVTTGQPGTAMDSQIPVGQSEEPVFKEEEPVGAEIFGKQSGYIHPFLLFEARWTDNLFNTHTNEQEDFITSVAPGLWLALPANREKLLEIGTTTTSPGGLQLSRIKPATTRQYQAYLLYSPEFVFYSKHSDQDTVNHKAEGLFQYNFDSGLSIDVIDQFNKNHVSNDNGISEELEKYQDNIFDVMLVYEPTEKLRFRVEYSNYDLDYKDSYNDYIDRNDDSIAVYVFFKIKPKTSIFAEYEFSDIEFDTNSDSDSTEDRYYAGVDWDVTAKTKGRIKLGYIEKDFKLDSVEDQDGFSFEIQGQHNFTPKRALLVEGFRRFNESTFSSSNTYLTSGAIVALLQRFNDKWSGTLEGAYTNNQYKGPYTYEDVTQEREDDIFSIAPALRYEFREWMNFDLGYIYTKRDSNFTVFDYINNTIFFRASVNL